MRERYTIRADEAGLEAVFAIGTAKARAITTEVLADVRAGIGVGVPR